MTEVKHTPGPWTSDGSHIYAPDGAIIAVVHNPGSSAADYPLVANRNLMAAAPDLLAVAIDCLELARLAEDLCGCRGDDDYVDGIQERLNAALSKAS